MKLLILILILNSFALACKKSDNVSAEAKKETDDTANALTNSLVDTGKHFEDYINLRLESFRRQAIVKTPTGKDFLDKNKLQALAFYEWGREVEGSGVGWGVLEVSKLNGIERWFLDSYDPKQKEIAIVKWKNSKFGKTPLGMGEAARNKNPMIISEGIADLSLAPVVRMNGVLLGTDKWGHYFHIGHMLFNNVQLRNSPEMRTAFSYFLEGHPALPEADRNKYETIAKEIDSRYFFGVYGASASGMISLADVHANEFGFRFYQQLYLDPKNFRFELSKIELKKMNEQNVKSIVPEYMKTIE